MSEIFSIIEKFSNVKILVVGDVMLDRYCWGTVRRISPEAPVPVVNLERTSLAAGGAANVATNIAGLGAEAFLVGVVGQDEEASLFPKVLQPAKVSSEYLIPVKNRPTTVKTRIVAHNQQIVRLDQENPEDLDVSAENEIFAMIEPLLEEISVIVVSDYAKGVLTETLLARLIKSAKVLNKPVLVDPKGRNYKKYNGATLLTPNKSEAAKACNLEEDGQELVERAGKILLENYQIGALLVTQGEKGMTLFRKNQKPEHLEALARQVYDVTGAGDTVIASLGVAVGAGADLWHASQIANIAAGLVVEEVGTTAVDLDKLREAVGNRQKI